MTQTSVTPKLRRNSLGRLKREFYPLQKAELIALRKAKLINNPVFVLLALKYESHCLDDSASFSPKDFAVRWEISESSVHEAIRKLKAVDFLSESGYSNTEQVVEYRLEKLEQWNGSSSENAYVQDDWNNYGSENKVFEVLEIIPVFTQGSATLVWGSNAALRQLEAKWHHNFENTYSCSSWDSSSKNPLNSLAIKFRHHVGIEEVE